MSGYRDIWAVLGVARTANVAEIRSAYAQQLRSFDVDADPKRFMVLRDARDAALRLARQPRDVAAPVDIETADDDDGLSFSAPALPDATRITAHIERETPVTGTVVVDVPLPPEGDYRGDAVPVVAPATGDGEPLPDINARATFVPPVIDTGQQRGSIGVAMPDTAHEALIDQHYDAVRALLAPRRGGAGDDSYLDAAGEIALAGHMDALLADPRLEQIAFRDQAEAWFAEVAANAVPRSDSIVERLVSTFGWGANRGRIDQPYNVARVVARRDSLVFHRLVQEKKHPLNAAWRELVKPATAGSRRGFWVNRGDVQRLLKVVREHFPDLESCFDWYRVSLWEAPGRISRGGGAWRPAYFALILLLGVLRAAFSGSGDHAPPVAMPTPISNMAMMAMADNAMDDLAPKPQQIKAYDPTGDIAFALRAATGGMLTNEDVAANNPGLKALLAEKWRAAHDRRDTQAAFVDRTGRELLDRAQAAMRHASYALAAESRRLELDRLEAARDHDPPVCGLMMEGNRVPPDLATRFADRENALTRHALLESDARDAAPPPRRGTFRVPGAVMKDAAARAALSHDDLVAALNGRASPSRTCNARIALLEAALALPHRDGLKLLREM